MYNNVKSITTTIISTPSAPNPYSLCCAMPSVTPTYLISTDNVNDKWRQYKDEKSSICRRSILLKYKTLTTRHSAMIPLAALTVCRFLLALTVIFFRRSICVQCTPTAPALSCIHLVLLHRYLKYRLTNILLILNILILILILLLFTCWLLNELNVSTGIWLCCTVCTVCTAFAVCTVYTPQPPNRTSKTVGLLCPYPATGKSPLPMVHTVQPTPHRLWRHHRNCLCTIW